MVDMPPLRELQPPPSEVQMSFGTCGPASALEAEPNEDCPPFLDVVVRERLIVSELLACKEQLLVLWQDALICMDHGFHNC